MPLSDGQIHNLAVLEKLLDPYYSKNLNSCGYDLTLGSEFKVPALDTENWVIDPFYPPPYIDQHRDDYIIIPPHSFVLGVSVEHLIMPPDIIGICLGRSTYARSGVISHVTPLEPGWRGQVTIEISNTNQLPVKVWVGKGITQVVFFRAEKMPLLDYERKGGRYQDQVGVTQGKPDKEESV